MPPQKRLITYVPEDRAVASTIFFLGYLQPVCIRNTAGRDRLRPPGTAIRWSRLEAA
jgi:hypothetical protein